jgi:DNA-binding transcriptional ArsR family regulator
MTAEDPREVFAALGDPIRRALIARLAFGPATAGQLAELADITRPGVSQHLRVLRDAEIVRASRDGRFIWYELDARRLAEAEHWLSELADRWADSPPLRSPSRFTAKETT